MTCQSCVPVPCPLGGEGREGDLVSMQGIGSNCPGSPLAWTPNQASMGPFVGNQVLAQLSPQGCRPQRSLETWEAIGTLLTTL